MYAGIVFEYVVKYCEMLRIFASTFTIADVPCQSASAKASANTDITQEFKKKK